MKKKFIALVCSVIMVLGFSSTALAAEENDLVGFVNVQFVLQNYPGVKDILQQISEEKAHLQSQYNEQAQNLSDVEKKDLNNNLNKEFAEFEKSKMSPVQANIQKAIAKAAKKNGITSVVNSNSMLFGGKDLTEEEVKELQN